MASLPADQRDVVEARESLAEAERMLAHSPAE